MWCAGRAGPWLLLGCLPLLRWLLAVSALVWPAWGQQPSSRRLRQTVANLQTVLLLTLTLYLLGAATRAAIGWAAAVVATRPRPPKPRATGQILDDGTYSTCSVALGSRLAPM